MESFGIVTDKCDGHDFIAIDSKITKLSKIKKPKCLIVNTVKGKGFKMMENKSQWHYWHPISKNEFDNSLKQMESYYAK